MSKDVRDEPFDYTFNRERNTLVNTLGHGAFYGATDIEDNPHEIEKRTRHGSYDREIDAFVAYAARPKQVYSFDIHSGNIMYRRTSVGLQLVLNDPLAQ